MKTCNICGGEFKNLGSHLKKHGKAVVKLAEEHILKPARDGLLGEEVRVALPVAEMQIDIPLTEETVTTQPEQDPVTNVNNCEYHLIMEFNNKKFECFTNNLKISILSYKPSEVLTDAFITIRKGNAEFIKKLPLIQARQLLNDNERLDIFLDTFYGLYGQPSNFQVR